MPDRTVIGGAVATAAGVLGICCGLPVLLSLGLTGALAGMSLGSWLLIGSGLAVAAFDVWRRGRRRHSSAPTRASGVPSLERARIGRKNDSTQRNPAAYPRALLAENHGNERACPELSEGTHT